MKTSQSKTRKIQEQLDKAVSFLASESVLNLKESYYGPLGAVYSKEETQFILWAPSASQVQLLVYEDFYGDLVSAHLMEAHRANGTFTYQLRANCHGLTYKYRLTFLNGQVIDSIDPYARASTVNGQRSVVVDLEKTNPPGWGERMPAMEDISQSVIYELHIRDFTIGEESGVVYKGKFLGASESGSKNSAGFSTGIDHLKKLGITHVQIMPMFDFQTIDESDESHYAYNWGYDPLNYNVPEGSYSTNPYHPMTRITELKKMIQAFHQAGIRVVMDVVYNHVYKVEEHSFHKTVPGYYFRYNSRGELTNGSGVGNDTASEKEMMRKYIVDSIKYWAEEYHLDGFRFDLMGLHDVKTMNEVRAVLDQIDPTILLYGEGWNLFTPFIDEQPANMSNAALMPRIGQFNDGLRDSLKGDDFDPKSIGFINGAWYLEKKVAENFLGKINSEDFLNPLQLIQYVEVHDNYTLYDRLQAADPFLAEEIIQRRHEFATTIILLSQGLPLIHSGQEFMRTKYGVRDSYNQPDTINQIDWSKLTTYQNTVRLIKGLIALRHNEPLFRMNSYREIRQRVEVMKCDYQIIEMILKADEYWLYIAFNSQANDIEVLLPEDTYVVKLYNGSVYLQDDLLTQKITKINMKPYTALILKRKMTNFDSVNDKSDIIRLR